MAAQVTVRPRWVKAAQELIDYWSATLCSAHFASVDADVSGLSSIGTNP
jgi:hypothetical protein